MVTPASGLPADAAEGAFVARAVPYGDNDLIVHLICERSGRVSAMARAARRTRSRFRARLEPLAQLTVVMRAGRGDLQQLTEAAAAVDRPTLRQSWAGQQTAARALDLLWRTSIEAVGAGPAFNLTHRLFDILDDDALNQVDAAPALLSGYAMKIMVLAGVAPELEQCIRCGDTRGLAWFSATDGGVVCGACARGSDRPMGAAVHAALLAALTKPLIALPDAGDPAAFRTAFDTILRDHAAEHLGVRVSRIHDRADTGR